jgi:corrinoid protein of di/trimethylamine methyltransferase
LLTSKTIERIREDLYNYNSDAIKEDVKKALEEKVPPIDLIKILSETMKDIGDKFSRLELFLTNLMMAGDTMKAALDVILPRMDKKDIPTKGKVVLGTVKDDIHDIGKNIVSALLTASGFEIIDLGKDVPSSKFVEEAERTGANVVAASALMSTTMAAMKDLVDYFSVKGVRNKYKIIVGGGPVTREYAKEIGADGYGENAVEAVRIVEELTRKK